MEWTNKLIFEFLNLYQYEPALWNSTAPEHKNRIDAYDAWNRIKNQLKDGNISINDIKKKRDNLMSTYRKQRTKVRKSMGTASGADDVYKPEWPFYDIMANFLNDVYKPKNTKSTEDSLDTEEIEEEGDVNDIQATTEQTPKTLKKKKTKRSRSSVCNEKKNRSDEAYKNLKQMSKTETDTSSLYCDLLCNKLRDLQESTRDIAMMEIDKIMYTLKQQHNHTMNFPNTVCQNIILPISEEMKEEDYYDRESPQPSCSSDQVKEEPVFEIDIKPIFSVMPALTKPVEPIYLSLPKKTNEMSIAEENTQTVKPSMSRTAPISAVIDKVVEDNFEEVEDDCSSFAAHIRMRMRRFEPAQKVIAQKLISDVMFMADTLQLNLASAVNPQAQAQFAQAVHDAQVAQAAQLAQAAQFARATQAIQVPQADNGVIKKVVRQIGASDSDDDDRPVAKKRPNKRPK